MPNYKNLPVGPNPPDIVYAIIEVPKGERNKYEYDPELEVFKLDRVLYSPVHYPTCYGFIPSTLSEDGDPLDILVITHGSTFVGCLIEVRPIGMLKMRDDKGLDDKILAVATHDPFYKKVFDIKDLQEHILYEIEHFFSVYKELEGKKVESYGWAGAEKARKVIEQAVKRLKGTKTEKV